MERVNTLTMLESLFKAAVIKRSEIFNKEKNKNSVFRLFNGMSDGQSDLYIEQLGCHTLFVHLLDPQLLNLLDWSMLSKVSGASSIYLKRATRDDNKGAAELVFGKALSNITAVENGIQYNLRPTQGYSFGLFTDQRSNRKNILESLEPGQTVLNSFAYTCAFSLCAAKAGSTVTSVDLSKNYLEWGKDNFKTNSVDVDKHDFIFGDVFDWFKRFARKGRKWDLIILDPPTFSRTKKGIPFIVEQQYPKLLRHALDIVEKGGRILCCQNKHSYTRIKFENDIRSCLEEHGPQTFKLDYATLPPEFELAPGQLSPSHSFWVNI